MANCRTCKNKDDNHYCEVKEIFIIDETPIYCEQEDTDDEKHSIERNTLAVENGWNE